MKLVPQSTIGKKFVMALTGLLLIGFLFFHLAGNLLLYFGEEAFNTYAYTLHSYSFLLYTAEIVLFLAMIYHIVLAVQLSILAKTARGDINYYQRKSSTGKSTLSSRTMAISGSVILIFIILHLVTFKIWDKSPVVYNGVEMEDVYANVLMWFSQGWYSTLYVLATILLGFHLKHAFYSSFKTLGIDYKNYTTKIKRIAIFISLFLAIGFGSFPIYFYFNQGIGA